MSARRATLRVAVIGTGAAGYAAVHALRRFPRRVRVDVFDPGGPPELTAARKDFRDWAASDFATVHRLVRSGAGRAFPPPRAHFGRPVPRHEGSRAGTVWRSQEPGGLTRYWSAAMFPYTDADLVPLGVSRATLDPYYRDLAAVVGIAGRQDPLDEIFGAGYVTRPAVEPTALADRLIDAVNRSGERGEGQLRAGCNRSAIETRAGHPRACVRCGGCLYGCFRGAIFHAGEAMARDGEPPQGRYIPARVRALRNSADGTVTVDTASGRFTGYDRVLCGAGCVGSAEILLRSFGEPGERGRLTDNDLYLLPVVHHGRRPADDPDRYAAVANAVVGHTAADGRYTHILLAPVPDYLLRCYVPERLWPMMRPLARSLRSRMLLAKIYVHSDVSRTVQARPAGTEGVDLEAADDGGSKDAARRAAGALTRSLRGTGFSVPPVPMVRSATSSHYAGSLAPAMAEPAADGYVTDKVRVIDSAAFPVSPAQPLTFTIMANAARIAEQIADG